MRYTIPFTFLLLGSTIAAPTLTGATTNALQDSDTQNEIHLPFYEKRVAGDRDGKMYTTYYKRGEEGLDGDNSVEKRVAGDRDGKMYTTYYKRGEEVISDST